MPLHLFRRHEPGCVRSPTAGTRSDRGSTGDCNCMIFAEGAIRRRGRLEVLARSTGERDWTSARAAADRWTDPFESEASPEAPVLFETPVTVVQAVGHFLTIQATQGCARSTLQQSRQLLSSRLLQFTQAKGIRYIQDMDNALVWAEFRHSWKNEDPFRNRPTETGKPAPRRELAPKTASVFVERLRSFLRLCAGRRWLTDNWASRRHGMTVHAPLTPKEPFEDWELGYIYEAAKAYCVRNDWHNRQSPDILAFLLVLRYTGLRFIDVVQLRTDQLVEFRAGSFTHAICCRPLKTSTKRACNTVFIPIPGGGIAGHPDVISALTQVRIKRVGCYFLGGTGQLRSNASTWCSRLRLVFDRAAEMAARDGRPFVHHPIAGRFRHTFAAALLRNQVPVRVIAYYLGVNEATVRKHYLAFCTADQIAAAETLERAMRAEPGVRPPVEAVKGRRDAASDIPPA